MSKDEASYRPKSPDLSSFFSSGPTEPLPISAPPPFPAHSVPPAPPHSDNSSHHHQPHDLDQHHQPSYTHHTSHHLHDNQPSLHPYLPHQSQHQQPPPNHQHHYSPNPQPYEYPPTTQSAVYGYGSPSFPGAPYAHPTSPRAIKSEDQPSYLAPGQSSLQTSQSGSFSHNPGYNDAFHQQPPFHQPYTDPSFQSFPTSGPYVPAHHSGAALHQPHTSGQPQHPVKIEQRPPMEQAQQPRPPPVNLPDPSPVKTKFPTARIKRIMQADEEVGKVAQQTPIAVGKALEMFMVQLVLTSADVAKEKGSKRVTAQMLKQVVETDEQWDFLRDIVSKVETNEKAGKGGGVKAESDSDEDEPKKKKGGRKRKTG